ncbi:MAG TPA: hypothetical protein VLA99_12060 [Nitrospiraceae bacterium]|nr:hypothetical protein [Nitrospiraceae bacterium]
MMANRESAGSSIGWTTEQVWELESELEAGNQGKGRGKEGRWSQPSGSSRRTR